MNTEDGINLVLFTEGTVSKLETVAAVSLGDTAMLECDTTGVGVLEETASKDVPGTAELFTCEAKGTSV